MALVFENGLSPLAYDSLLTASATSSAITTTLLTDAAGEKAAFVGNVWHPTVHSGTINIRKVHFRTGAVVLNAASQYRVSLQTANVTLGPPFQPSGTQDQFFDFKTATAVLAANAWQATGNLSADRVVNLASDSATDANSRRLAVVFEFQAFNTSDSVVISGYNAQGDMGNMAGPLLNTGTWASSANNAAIVAFECDDGSFAFMVNAYPIAATGSTGVSSTGAVRRAGLRFRFPTIRAIDRLALNFRLGNGADGRIVLYDSDGTTELRSIDVDNDDFRGAASDILTEVPIEPVTLAANTFYRLAVVGSTTTAATMYYIDVNAAGLMDGFILGQSAHWSQHDGTSWTDTLTRRPLFGLGICAHDDGVSAGSFHPERGFTGGIRG